MVSSYSYFLFRRRFVTLGIAVLLAICTAVFAPVTAEESCRAIVVRSAQLQPHLEVVRGLRDACLCSVLEITLGDGEGPEKVLSRSPDIVITVGTSGLKRLKEISDLPLIYAMAVPAEALLCQGPNISGVSMDLSPATHLEAMRQIFPGKKRIGVIYDPRLTGAFMDEAVNAARASGRDLIVQQVSEPSKFPAALSALKDRIDIFWMLPDASIVTAENVELLLRFSFQNTVPVFTFSRKYVEMGAVASLDTDPYDIGVQVGEIANRIKGRPAAVREYARTPHVTVNRKVAGKMGFRITEEMVKRANGSN